MNSERMIGEEKAKYKMSWVQIESQLPKDADPRAVSFLRHYFRAQLRIAQGKNVKARRIFGSLVKRQGYEEFESHNQQILAAIDVAVKGHTRWTEKPEFKINKWNSSSSK